MNIGEKKPPPVRETPNQRDEHAPRMKAARPCAGGSVKPSRVTLTGKPRLDDNPLAAIGGDGSNGNRSDHDGPFANLGVTRALGEILAQHVTAPKKCGYRHARGQR